MSLYIDRDIDTILKLLFKIYSITLLIIKYKPK